MNKFLIAIAILVTDIFTKKIVCKNMKIGEKKEIVKKRFYFWYIKNKGAAYNSFEGYMPIIKCISVIGILYCAFHMKKDDKMNSMGCTFLLGGALGNFIERIRYGEVTDFLYFEYQNKNDNSNIKKVFQKCSPIFNVADIFIAIGAILFVISNIIKQNEK
ncbi:signal peptidase II [Lachnospiraceae bacterium 46-61]